MTAEAYKTAAYGWLKKNTNVDTETETPEITLFVQKYKEVMGLRAGVSSESISGLSQSFNVADVNSTLRQYAMTLFGDNCLTTSDVKAFPYEDRWTY